MQQPSATLTCPKCRGAMASYERSGIVIDQCTECRGIFLDRGELERFVDLASGGVEQPTQPQWTTPEPDRAWRQQPPQHRDYRHQGNWDRDSDSYKRHSGKYYKKRKSLLGELFDF
jgi:Zn-finger nucleic acid-binding protein